MKTETKQLTAHDLALYMGRPVRVYDSTGTRVGIDMADRCIQVEGDEGGMGWFLPSEVKPILRPLSSLTEEEAQEIGRIGDWRFPFDCLDLECSLMDIVKEYALVWRYLLSIGIDIFGWIESGLAIDKTKL
jgi:hypothetical protein